MTYELGEIILERDFELLDAQGNEGTVKLHIGKPYKVSEAKWHCPYQITGITSETVKAAPGRDAIEAMLTSLRMAEVFLTTNHDTKVTWQGDEELCLHFPPLEISRDQEQSLSENENSPFKAAFDEFFRNLDQESKTSSSSTPKQSQ